jgi:1-phosphatidylinositol-3-phosphate 5-kinase
VLYEVVYPPMRIRVRPESQLELKNSDFERLHRRNATWYTALVDDLKLISIDAATGDEKTDTKLMADINSLIARAEREKEDIAFLINKIYNESAPTDTLELNQVRSQRQDRIVEWQLDFDRLPKPRPAQITDKNSHKPSAFGSVRAIFPRRYDLAGAFDNPHIASSGLSEAGEVLTSNRRVTGDSMSSASEASEPETAIIAHTSKTPTYPSATEPLLTTEEACTTSSDALVPSTKSDPDSDSTIGVPRDDNVSSNEKQLPHLLVCIFNMKCCHITHLFLCKPEEAGPDEGVPARVSRLPRRTTHPSSVANLVKKYQDFLPAQGVHDLAKTAFPPRIPISESDQEYSVPVIPRNVHRKTRHPPKKSGTVTSDFESGYAANVAPRYLTRSRRSKGLSTSRIPGPILSSTESHESSRRTSPDKRIVSGRAESGSSLGRLSPAPGGRASSIATSSRSGRTKSRPTLSERDKMVTRPPLPTSNKSHRRTPGPGSKVSNIAKHFERMSRDSERTNRRYSVIRGRRARPVATARAKVEVLHSVKDAVKDDESESPDSSSEADDEGDGNDERRMEEPTPENSSPNASTTLPQVTVESAPDTQVASPPNIEHTVTPETQNISEPPTVGVSEENPEHQTSIPPSPFLNSVQSPSFTPPHDIDIAMAGTQSTSLLKTLGLWLNQPQPRHRSEVDIDDPMIDPEHIFRDSSMVVRTDEPTSIIALALK